MTDAHQEGLTPAYSPCTHCGFVGPHECTASPSNLQRDVALFQDKFGFDNRAHPDPSTQMDSRLLNFRIRLMMEEFAELVTSMTNEDLSWREWLEAVADGAVDTVYTVLGTMCALGVDFQAVWDEVQRANMEKELGPGPYGKPMKPFSWVAPQLDPILFDDVRALPWVKEGQDRLV